MTDDVWRPRRIMYVCECCAENAPEMCGRWEPTEIALMPNGAWLCEDCVDNAPLGDYGVEVGGDEYRPLFSDFPHPPKYVPPPQEGEP